MSASLKPRCGKPMRAGRVCGLPAGHSGKHWSTEAYRRAIDRRSEARRERRYVISTHGYGGYANGCRCETCTAAKAAYMSAHRIAATASAQPGVAVTGVTHGTRSAYKDKGCRCEKCTEFMRSLWRRWSRDARQPEGAVA
jgi:hypothetical protein